MTYATDKYDLCCTPLFALFVDTGAAVGREAVLFSAGGASEPAGAFRMSLEVRDETPVTAHPAHVAADPPVCADEVTSFSAIEPFNYINITSFEITEICILVNNPFNIRDKTCYTYFS